MLMKKIRSLLLLIFILGIFPSITLCEETNQEVYINIDTPIYSVENTNTIIKFIVVNNGTNSFNGSLIYLIKGEGLQWGEFKENITIQPHNSTMVSVKIKPAYTGQYTITARLNDVKGRQIIIKNYPLNVHSLVDGIGTIAAIIGIIIAFLALEYSKNK